MARLIEETEIDEWFTEQKDALAEKMQANLEKGADSAKEKERFNKAYGKLFTKYNKMHNDADAYKERQAAIQKPIKAFAAWRKAKVAGITNFWQLKKEQVKKAWFEWNYRRIFKIKQRKI